MTIRRVAPFLLIAALIAAAPAAGQWLPDHIPDNPDETLEDRTRERMIERYRGVLGRFFIEGSVAMAPFDDPTYQAGTGVGLILNSGDAMLLSAAVRTVMPAPDTTPAANDWKSDAWLVGAAYEMRGTRIFGSSPLGWRTGLGLGLGVMSGTDFAVTTFDITPTYDLVVRHDWSVPVGLRLSVATFDMREPGATFTRVFLGPQIGVRWHVTRREKLR